MAGCKRLFEKRAWLLSAACVCLIAFQLEASPCSKDAACEVLGNVELRTDWGLMPSEATEASLTCSHDPELLESEERNLQGEARSQFTPRAEQERGDLEVHESLAVSEPGMGDEETGRALPTRHCRDGLWQQHQNTSSYPFCTGHPRDC